MVLTVVVGVIASVVALLATGGTPAAEPVAAQTPMVACGAARPAPGTPQTYARPPRPMLKRGIDYRAVVFTSCGDMRIDLLEDGAPRAVNNFVFLAREGFYNGLVFNQVIRDFIVQGGDPNGRTGVAPDGPGYTIKDELLRGKSGYRYGTVGFANNGSPNSSGSQFFIVVHDYAGAVQGEPAPLRIDQRYTVFGEVGPDFYGSLETIARQPVAGGQDRILAAEPQVPIFIERIEIVELPRKNGG